jgi:hypothetical protein
MGEVKSNRLSQEDFLREQERLLGLYRAQWRNALISAGETDLWTSLVREVAAYYDIADLGAADRYCNNAVVTLQQEWQQRVNTNQRASIENFTRAQPRCTS